MHILKQSELHGMPCPDTLIHGDCLEAMKHIADSSVDMILCDLPYGTTACKWDTVIPFEPLWEAYKRVIKPNGAIVLFGSQPFTSRLVCSNLEWFKYEWVYQKSHATGFLHAKNKPMKKHENVLVFSGGTTVHASQSATRMPYFPQNLTSINIQVKRTSKSNTPTFFPPRPSHVNNYTQAVGNYPQTIISFPAKERGQHPTQKPVALCEYLIKTYSSTGDLVLDNCMGSATTPVACLNTGRHFIGIEKNDTYFSAGCDRVRARKLDLDSTLQF